MEHTFGQSALVMSTENSLNLDTTVILYYKVKTDDIRMRMNIFLF